MSCPATFFTKIERGGEDTAPHPLAGGGRTATVFPGLKSPLRGAREVSLRRFPYRDAQLSIAVLCVLLAIAVPASGADDLETRLERGEIVTSSRSIPGSDLPEGTSQAVIEAPPAKVWAVIDDCGRYKGVMPRVIASRQVERKGDKVQCEITVKIPVLGELKSITEATHIAGPPKWSRTWHLLTGADYKVNEGSWTLTAFDAAGTRTRAVYKMHAELNAWVPGFIVKRGQTEGLMQVMQGVRSAVK